MPETTVFPQLKQLPNYYNGTIHKVNSESELNDALLNSNDFDIIEFESDVVLTTTKTINKKLKLRAILNTVSITFNTPDLGGLFTITSSEVWINNLTFNNSNTSNNANILNFSDAQSTDIFVTNCIFNTNEFAIVTTSKNIQITNNVFKFVGTADSHRYIMFSACSGTSFVSNNIFEGNGASTQCINLNNSISPTAFVDGNLVISNNVSQNLAVQRLLMVDISLENTNFGFYVNNNTMTCTSGFMIFYTLPLKGVKEIYVLNNTEILPELISGSKGIIGLDSITSSVIDFNVQIYSANNVVPELRSDYTDLVNPLSNQPRVVAYATSKFTPEQTFTLSNPLIGPEFASSKFKSILLTDTNLDNLEDFSVVPKVYVDNKISDLINGAPEQLDTLKEIADALNNDPNLGATLIQQITTESSERIAADGQLQSNLNNETINRSAADIQLQLNIDSEVSARIDALNAEANARANDVSQLQLNIDSEVSARVDALNAEANARANDISILDNSKLNKAGDIMSGLLIANNSIKVNIKESSYLYIGNNWRINGSNDGKSLIFEYSSTGNNPWTTAVPFIQL
jgi:hypothetical protein